MKSLLENNELVSDVIVVLQYLANIVLIINRVKYHVVQWYDID